ncbi:hypothetical protein [Neobacillus notoginsengisoli]|nr:hypothetical protein [Neobacillus notoginsengisoli]
MKKESSAAGICRSFLELISEKTRSKQVKKAVNYEIALLLSFF